MNQNAADSGIPSRFLQMGNCSSAFQRAGLRDWATYVALFLIVALAAYLRFKNLGDDSLWRDEAASWEQAQGNLFQIISTTARDNYPPLHNLILAVSMRLFGDGEWALRLPSAIIGVLNVLAIYWVSLAALAALLRETDEPVASRFGGPPSAQSGLEIAPPASLYILIAWAFLPVLLGLAASILTAPILVARYLIGSLPAILLLAGIGFARFARSWLSLATVFALTAGVSWFALTYASPEPREDWRGAAELFAKTFHQGNCLFVPGEGGLRTLRYYYREPIECVYSGSAKAIDPARVPSDLVFVILFGSNNRGADVLKAFLSPPWKVGGEVPFRGISVVAMIRSPP